MCGRYTLSSVPDPDYLVMPDDPNFIVNPRFNIAPSQWGAVIPQSDTGHIHFYKWGLIPYWAKDPKIAFKLINARGETVHEKPSFRTAFKNRRCLVLADGFYEWKKTRSGKQPYRIMLKSEKAFYFAGLYDIWISPEGKEVKTYTIITTEPNELTAEIHDRMPVILNSLDTKEWLSENTDREDLLSLMRPFPASDMKAYPVSTAVGNVRNDSPELIKPIEKGPPDLFT